MPNIRLPDGSSKSFPGPVTVAEIGASIGAGLARAALAGKVNGKLVDTSHRIDADADVAIVTERDPEGLEILRHSTAHLLAHAVKELFPDAQVTIGPVIENGFYYDFSYKRAFTPEDLAAIEKKMAEISKRDLPVARKEDQDAYLKMLEEAEKRDHRRLGTQLDLFHQQEEAPGLVFWHPKGWVLWQQVEQYMRRVYRDNGYQEVRAPQILDRSLWERTGHWQNFRESMFVTSSENRDYAIKPMNCPGHILIYNKGVRSYRDLPLRYGEFGSCHRNEPSGALHGLMRVRGFVQDDGHIFCTEDHILPECVQYTALLQRVYRDFGFTDIIYKVATRPQARIGADDVWDKAEKALMEALERSGVKYQLSPGEGAFYGPKIEYSLKDGIGRVWQCGTMQVDFSMPGRLGAEYVAEDNTRRTPVMLHRAIVGSFERFIGILIEHHGGAFPLWLAPVQAVVLNITERQDAYARQLMDRLRGAGFRVNVDLRNEKINYKIREHSLQKLPYQLVVGDKEMQAGTVAVRARGGDDLGTMPAEGFRKRLAAG